MSDVKRVLLVFGKLNRGGAETLVMNLYRNMDREKLQFDFIKHTDEPCAYDEEIESLGGRIYSMPRYNGKNHFAYKKRWNDFFLHHTEYKIVHAHMSGSAAVFLPIAKKFGCYAISHSHSVAPKVDFRQIIVNSYRFPLRRISDYMFACSNQAGQWMFGKSVINKKNYSVLKNGVDLDKFSFSENKRKAIRKEFAIDEDTFVVGNVSRFHQKKNHLFLIDIFKELHKRNNNSVLFLAGDGESRAEIEKKVNDEGLTDCVILAGVRSDVDCILSAMDVFVMPSFFEGLPVSLVEAQASGLKIVATDTISPEVELTDLVTLFSTDKPAAEWADIIIKNCGSYERRDTGQCIAAAGYDIKQTAKWLQDFYLKIYSDKE